MECKVIDLFKVTRGDIVILEFSEGAMPHLGDILKNKSNHKWKISEIAHSNAIRIPEYEKMLQSDRVWNCTLVAVNEGKHPNVGEILEIEYCEG